MAKREEVTFKNKQGKVSFLKSNEQIKKEILKEMNKDVDIWTDEHLIDVTAQKTRADTLKNILKDISDYIIDFVVAEKRGGNNPALAYDFAQWLISKLFDKYELKKSLQDKGDRI